MKKKAKKEKEPLFKTTAEFVHFCIKYQVFGQAALNLKAQMNKLKEKNNT